MGRTGWLGVLVGVLLPGLAAAQTATQTDPGDLVFWQSVQNSRNPAEYRAYLEAYPTGRFAGLAQARLRDLGGAAPAPTPALVPADTNDASEFTVAVAPPGGRVGQVFTVRCTGLPEGSYDKVVVVPAGTPVMDPSRSADDTKVLWQSYTNQCPNLPRAGPFAPGAYELRWMTTLYNNERRYEMKAKAAFAVR